MAHRGETGPGRRGHQRNAPRLGVRQPAVVLDPPALAFAPAHARLVVDARVAILALAAVAAVSRRPSSFRSRRQLFVQAELRPQVELVLLVLVLLVLVLLVLVLVLVLALALALLLARLQVHVPGLVRHGRASSHRSLQQTLGRRCTSRNSLQRTLGR